MPDRGAEQRVQGCRLRLPPGLGGAFWMATLLLALAELALHSETVMFQYRAVFAVGRAYDKLFEVERRPPPVLFIGNSRTDNGIDPQTVDRVGLHARPGFNLGLPGANAIVYQGEIRRLDDRKLLGKTAIHTAVFGLDESALQEDNSLGYISFLADRRALWDAGRYRDWLASLLRLWSYSGNLRELREPDKALRFVEASVRSLDPVGARQRRIGAIGRDSARPRMRARWRNRKAWPCTLRHRPSSTFCGRRSICCRRAACGYSSPCRPCAIAPRPLSILAPRPPPTGHCWTSCGNAAWWFYPCQRVSPLTISSTQAI